MKWPSLSAIALSSDRLSPVKVVVISAGLFLLIGGFFFALVGQNPWKLFPAIFEAAFGSPFAWTETLLKTSPILLCAIATALPAKLGLISVGAEGQLYLGALMGTAPVLAWPDGSNWLLLPAMLLFGMLGGTAWAGLPALLKAWLGVNETISTLLLNYVAVLVVNFAVYGPWKDAANLGWPATAAFPEAAQLPTWGDSKLHWGVGFSLAATLFLFFLLSRSRWGMALRIMRSNRKLALGTGFHYERQVLIVMAIAGAFAGIAGIVETAMIQGRLQPDISSGYGLSGFLVAWMAGQNFLFLIPLAILVGGLAASTDALQLFAQLPSSSALVMQGILFMCVLAVSGFRQRAVRLP
ncbi:ABC transporter permease [filamentous cyanobacterium CCP5]|nr:ABC transporter permease [filamentous cyanobacterium CCP5]